MDNNKQPNETQALLEYIYKNAEMGAKTLSPLTKKSKDNEFSAVLDKIRSDYEEIHNEATGMLTGMGFEPASGLNKAENLMTDMAITMHTLMDKSVPHFAEMVLKGATMGVRDISKRMHEWKHAEESARSLAKRLLELNYAVIDQMKPFLLTEPRA